MAFSFFPIVDSDFSCVWVVSCLGELAVIAACDAVAAAFVELGRAAGQDCGVQTLTSYALEE